MDAAQNKRKIVVLGDTGSGKTSLLSVINNKSFPDVVPNVFPGNSNPTQASADCKIDVKLDEIHVLLTFWDTVGRTEDDRVCQFFYPDTDVALLCYAVDDVTTLHNLVELWAPEVKKFCRPNVPIVVVGTKADVEQSCGTAAGAKAELVDKETADTVARMMNAAGSLVLSAKTQDGVQELLEYVAMLTVMADREKRKNDGCIVL